MRSTLLEALFPFGRRRPSLRFILGGIKDRLMSTQQTIETIAADVRLNAQVTVQTAALAGANAAAIQALGETVAALAKASPANIDTSKADAALAGIADQLAPLLATVTQTGGALPGTPATQAAPAREAETGATTTAGGAADETGAAVEGPKSAA